MFADVVDAAHIGVSDLACVAHFATKSIQRAWIQQGSLHNELQRNGLSQLQIVGAIDFTHTASAHKAHDPKAIRQDRARDKATVV